MTVIKRHTRRSGSFFKAILKVIEYVVGIGFLTIFVFAFVRHFRNAAEIGELGKEIFYTVVIVLIAIIINFVSKNFNIELGGDGDGD